MAEDDERAKSGSDRGDSGDRRRPAHGQERSTGHRDKKPYGERGERKPYGDRDRKPYGDRDRKPYGSGADRKPYGDRGDRKPYGDRDRQPYGDRDRKPYGNRDGKPYGDRDRKPYGNGADRKPYGDRGERKPYGDRSDRKPYGDRGARGRVEGRDDRRTTRPPQSERENRPLDPRLPDDITPRDLHPAARNELKTLSKENAERVARHLAMAAQLIDEDVALAHEHALAASRHAGRIPVARETVAITAYATGDFALALRELRTYRRLTGRDDQIALMVDSERGMGRPERALEEGRSVDRAALPTEVRVNLAIAMSGAWLDLGDAQRALQELEIPEADPERAFDWSPALFSARAAVLDELGRDAEAARWQKFADVAAEALDEAAGVDESELIVIEELDEPENELPGEDEVPADDEAPADDEPPTPAEAPGEEADD